MSKNFIEVENSSAKRLIGIAAVILLHLVIFYALLTGLNHLAKQPVEKPVELYILQDNPIEPEKPKPKEIPPEPPKIVKEVSKTPEPQKVVEKVEKTVKAPTVASPQPTHAATQATATSPSPSPSPSPTVSAPAPVAAAAPAKPTGATRGVSKGEAGCKQPDFPRDALQNEEQGTVVISVLVDATGKVAQAKVKKSSGSKSLDRAASKAFSLCTFKPALKDGEPQESWYDIPYEFVLE